MNDVQLRGAAPIDYQEDQMNRDVYHADQVLRKIQFIILRVLSNSGCHEHDDLKEEEGDTCIKYFPISHPDVLTSYLRVFYS
jgi:hypothetical protein